MRGVRGGGHVSHLLVTVMMRREGRVLGLGGVPCRGGGGLTVV